MSFENEDPPASWEEIKQASRRLDWGGREKVLEAEKRVMRRYLSRSECDDSRSEERLAIPGYN